MRACYCGGGMHARKRARVSFYLCGARGETERVRARIGKIWPANTEGRGQRTMLGSDETLQRRTAANCRRTLLLSMRPLNGHTITASMRTRARSATAAQNGAKCQLGSAASIDVILAVAGSRESTVGSNRSESKGSVAAMTPPAGRVFRGGFAANKARHSPLSSPSHVLSREHVLVRLRWCARAASPLPSSSGGTRVLPNDRRRHRAGQGGPPLCTCRAEKGALPRREARCAVRNLAARGE